MSLIRKHIASICCMAFLIVLMVICTQNAFAADGYYDAVHASALKVNTKETVKFKWDTEAEYFPYVYKKFTPSETGIYDFFMYNQYGTPNADDIFVDFYPTPDDAYLSQNDIISENSEYLVSDAAKFKSIKLQGGKTYYLCLCNYSTNSSYATYPIKIAKHVHVWTLDRYEKATFGLFSDGGSYWICDRCGEEKSEEYPSININDVAISPLTYTGKPQTPTIILKDWEGKVIPAVNYTVTYSNNVNVGTATATIKCRGNYTGTESVEFTINPKPTNLTRVKASRRGFTAKWRRQTPQVNGYELEYSTDKNFRRGVRTAFAKKSKTTSKRVKRLKSRRRYYVRVRTYKVVDGDTYFSSWSNIKAVKVR